MYLRYDDNKNPCLLKYRRMVLEATKKSKDYVGTVDVYGKWSNKSRRFSINYRKGVVVYHLFHREEDRKFAEEVDNDFGGTKVMYPNYGYDVVRYYDIGSPPKKMKNRKWTTDSAIITSGNLYLLPALLFLRAACFDEKIDDELLECVLEEAGVEMYESPMRTSIVNAETGEALGGIDKLSAEQQIVSTSFGRYITPLSTIYNGDYRIVRRKSKKDRIDEILLKADFEGMIEDNDYYLEGVDRLFPGNGRMYTERVGVRRKGDGRYLLRVGYGGDEHILGSVGGVDALIFLRILTENKPAEITDRFKSYHDFKRCVDAKSKQEIKEAKISSRRRTFRFTRDIRSYLEDELFWRKTLLESVKELYT